MQALDIPTDVEWMYMIRTSHKTMHTGVERHTLHSTVDLVGGATPTANGRGVEPAHSVLFRRPPLRFM
jgi:hypothetical protein